ncbi:MULTISPECIES: transcriptional repressor LexA [Methylobacter]|uniref:transcriptional repressor LexA n=1 Tax=Methylobacter TaxID=429 RepID=UPI001FAE67ED|nr:MULTISPECIES: transcriptional repressor LexA [Methylobacter]UOA07417.1 transcriptional repressor LexA [Methylobacter sp. S3L5C]
MSVLTRRQREIFNFLRDNTDSFSRPPSLDELCAALGMASRGSLYKHIMALIKAGLVEPFAGNKQGGVRLTTSQVQSDDSITEQGLPFVGSIAAGKPIEALATVSYMTVPDVLKTDKSCYVLQIKGDSMIEAGIFDGDWVVIEQRDYASNGEIVVALIDNAEATLKYIEQAAEQVLLLPANANISVLSYRPEQVVIQGVLVGQMRSYRSH